MIAALSWWKGLSSCRTCSCLFKPFCDACDVL